MENYSHHWSKSQNSVIAPNFVPEGCGAFKSSMTKWYFYMYFNSVKCWKNHVLFRRPLEMLILVLPATLYCPAMESAADCWKGSQTNCFPVRPSPSDRRYRRWYLRKAWHRLGRTCCRGMSSSRLPPDHYSMPSARFFAQDSHSPRIGLQTFLMPESENMK